MERVKYATVNLSGQLKPLNAGSFGKTYRSTIKNDDGEDVEVAVKLVRFTKDYDKAAFQAEVEIAKFASERGFGATFHGAFVRGSNIGALVTELLKHNPTEMDHAYVDKVFDLVARMHASNILHMDLYQGNVMQTKAGEPRVIDFGASWLIQDGKLSREVAALDYVSLFFGKHDIDESFGEGAMVHKEPLKAYARGRVREVVGDDALLSAIRKRYSVTGTLEDPTGMSYNSLHVTNSVFVDTYGMFQLICSLVHPEFYSVVGETGLSSRLFFASNNDAPRSSLDVIECKDGNVTIKREVRRAVDELIGQCYAESERKK